MHRERSGLTTTCGCLFGFVYKKKPTYLERFIREEEEEEEEEDQELVLQKA